VEHQHPNFLGPALATVLGEILEGADPDSGWLLNHGDPGLLRSLDRLSAEQASARATETGSSIAAHVEHLRYGLALLNRWSRGEDPFADADWSASWRRPAVSPPEWDLLRSQLRTEGQQWQQSFERLISSTEAELTGVIASIAHLAYHLGAIRQIDREMRGPTADD
jgi:hypothetical protein